MAYRSERIRLLFFWGNAIPEQPLDVEGEFKDIAQRLKLGYFDDAFEIKVVPQTSIEEFLGNCNSFRPRVIHFGGHGEREGHLVFTKSDDGKRVSQDIPADLLEGIFKAIAGEVSLVVLNACFSEKLAQRLRSSVDCVIGTTASIGDDAAKVFAAGFYGALAAGRSIGQAFDQGKVSVQISQSSPATSRHLRISTEAVATTTEAALYAIRTRDGIDPYLSFLVQDDSQVTEATRNDVFKDLELYRQRIESYRKLWALTEALAKYAREKKDFTTEDAERLSAELRRWYFQEGGLFLSQRARTAYFAFQEELRDIVKRHSSVTESLDEHSFEEVRNKSSILRTALAHDVGARK